MKAFLSFFKYFFIIAFTCITQFAFSQTIVGQSLQTTATEKNNARLLVYDNSGSLHVVYYNNGIYHSVSCNDGCSWTTPYLVTGLGRNPSIAIDTNNVLHLVFKAGGVNAYDIGHYKYENGIWTDLGILYHNNTFFSSRPVIAVDSDNNLHCVWQISQYGTYSNSEILYKKYTAGTGWAITATQISKTIGASEYPTLTIDSNNKIYVFWKDSEETTFYPKRVLMKKYTSGSGWDISYSIACETSVDDNYATMDPSVITDSQNNIHLVWKDNHTGQTNVYHKKFNGTSWGTAEFVSLTETSSINPIISVDNLDNLYVVWAEKNANYFVFDIVSKKYIKSTGIWEDMINISNTNNVDSRNPNIPIISKDSLLVVWTEGDTNPFDIMVNRSPLTGINSPIIISENGQITIFPNPSNGVFTVSIPNDIHLNEDSNLEIYDMVGKLIFHSKIYQQVGGQKSKIDISMFPKGMYFLKIKTLGKIYVERFIKN